MNDTILPDAQAFIKGSPQFESVSGEVRFYQTGNGVFVSAVISGLPVSEKSCGNRVFGFHIHEGDSCTGSTDDVFANAKMHYDNRNCPHPLHSGDMPPLFGNNGNAVMGFLTDRFTVSEIIGRTIIIHSGPDDFTTQPSGNSGKKIACGVIKRVE